MPRRSKGLSTLSLPDFPPAEQAVLKFLLSRDTVTESVMQKELKARQFNASEIYRALGCLEEQGCLRKILIGDKAVYSIRLAQRGPNNLAEVNLRRRNASSSLTSVIHMLEALEAPAKPEAVAPPRKGIFFVLIAFAIVNSFVLGVLDVTAISGFVTQLGTRNLPWLWIAEMLIGLVISGGYLGVIDRLGRPLMMKILLGLLVGIYAVIFGLFMLGIPSQILYPLVYIIYSQQLIVFPIVFWNLSTGFYSMAEARSVFPALASGEMIGNLIGYSLFSLPALVGLEDIEKFIYGNPAFLVGVSTALLLASLVVGLLTLRASSESPRTEDQAKRDFFMDLHEAYETIRAVPLFRYLFATILLVWMVLTILWYQFYTVLEQMSSSPDSFSTFYSIFEIGLMLVPLVLQWVLISTLMRRIPPRNAAMGIPIVLLASLAVSMIWPLPMVAIAAVFFPIILDKAWDTPAFQSLQNLIPMDCRGRVSAVLNNYSYAFGAIGGSLLMVMVLTLGGLLAWSSSSMLEINAALAILAALGAVAAAWQVRSTYEDSMFSWRLMRRRRTDLLEKIK